MLRSATRAAALAIAGITGLIGVAAAQTVMIAPATGQTPQQQAADQHACETDAAARTGYHPAQPPPTAPTPPPTGQRLAGAAGGAALGAARQQTTSKSGRVFDNPVGAGAVAGVVAGGARQHQVARQQQAQAQQQQAVRQQQQTAYMQTFTACLRGRGYTVQ